ncbi:MAG TPA: FAD-dependent oxidoreductase [Devosia sp.]|nr:FAD-dependent oxidoreductase [Devosia sp.]
MIDEPQVLIIGAGPAGLGAAEALARRGVERVQIVEREARAGGIPLFCPHPTFGLTEFLRPMSGPRYAERLVAAVDPAQIATRSTVTAISRELEVSVSTPEGMRTLRPQRVLVATGIRETPRSARLVSGDRPANVLTTGALQRMVASGERLPFKRPVVVGSELVSFSALLTLRDAGVAAVAMLEANDRITAQRPGELVARLLLGTPVLTRTRLVSINSAPDNAARMETVTVEGPQGQRDIACDAVIFTGAFVPEATVLAGWPGGTGVDQDWRLAEPRIYAAGNVLRSVETAAWSRREGVAAGKAIARDIASGMPPDFRTIPVTCTGPVALSVPAAIAVPGGAPGPLQMQVRMGRAARGRFTIALDGRVVWRSGVMRALPERRIGLTRDLPSLDDVSAIEIGFEEATA